MEIHIHYATDSDTALQGYRVLYNTGFAFQVQKKNVTQRFIPVIFYNSFLLKHPVQEFNFISQFSCPLPKRSTLFGLGY